MQESLTNSNDTTYQFTPTQDWFSHNIQHWTALSGRVESSHPRVLEIGSWEGRSAVFLLDNLCKDGGEIICIDHFDLLQTEAGRLRFDRINHNLKLTGKKSRVLEKFSVPALMTILEEEMSATHPGFDWIYIDGSHEAHDTMLDGELAWRLARKGAIVIFDDYHWDKEPEESIHHPKRGIEAFLTLHAGEYERLSDDAHYQVILQKLTEMRIGFLVADKAKERLDEALGYGINIVLTVDSAYAIGAAVTIRSTIESTLGRITTYIVDCGLTQEDRKKLKQTLDRKDNVTMVFLELPKESLAKKMGPSWAKLDMPEILPVERVLYLDADTLIRRNLRDLWDIDLGDIGVAADISHPMGHEAMERRPYFNAGVMLIDLAKARLRAGELKDAGVKMEGAKFGDQDALNMHFAGLWVPLALEWNAQGLGTYAKHPSADREALAMESMENPSIVPFTGPIYPSLAEVLNPYVQPPTAKPWRYAGAPGHPYGREWWEVLERTAWKRTKSSETLRGAHAREMQNALDVAGHSFREALRSWSDL
ncbi:glycosyltransferase family 8 protein [Flammula alnicola]|nr:glycosyltransferase family 8 protein [Flammula alnicola]